MIAEWIEWVIDGVPAVPDAGGKFDEGDDVCGGATHECHDVVNGARSVVGGDRDERGHV